MNPPTTSETTETKASAAEHERRMAELKSRHNGPRPDSPEAQRALRSAAFDDLFAYAQSLASDRDRLAKELEQERAKRKAAERPRTLDEWSEKDGVALWWRFPIVEPPHGGSPLDDDFPDYVTHWTPLLEPDGSRAGGAGGKTK